MSDTNNETGLQIRPVNAEEFGIESKVAEQVKAQFMPMLEKMAALETEYNAIIAMPQSKERSAKAKELRLILVKIRTGTAAIHKTQKEQAKKFSDYVDAWKKTQEFAGSVMEEQLAQIEKFEQIEAQKRKEKLQTERMAQLLPYEFANAQHMDLGGMEDSMWDVFFSGVKTQYDTKKENERIAEEQRVKREKSENIFRTRQQEIAQYKQFIEEGEGITIETSDNDYLSLLSALQQRKEDYDAEQLRIKEENDRLTKEKEIREATEKKRDAEMRPYLVFIRDYTGMLGMEEEVYQKELADIKKGAMDHWEFERQKEEKQAQLQEQRMKQLVPFAAYGEQVDMGTLWNIPEPVFAQLLIDKKTAYEEHQAREQRKAMITARVARLQDRGFTLDESLQEYSHDKIPSLISVKEVQSFTDESWSQVIADIDHLIDAKKDEEAREKVRLQKEKEDNDKKEKEEKDRIAAEKKAAKEPDKKKLQSVLQAFIIEESVAMKTEDGKAAMQEIKSLLADFLSDANKIINTL